MLTLIVGNGTREGVAQFHTALAAWQKKNPQSERTVLTAEVLTPLVMEELLYGVQLFGAARVATGVRLCEDALARELLVEHALLLADSETTFILFEEDAPAALIAAAEKKGTLIKARILPEERGPNPFVLGDALAARDRRGLWLELMRARRRGEADEDILPRLIWQTKALVLAGVMTEKESGLKPFPYKKARAARAKWSDEELERLHGELVFLLPAQVAGKRELDIALERTLLEFV